MLEALNTQPADKILALVAQFKADPRANKIDLGVGVYKDSEGKTPIMRAVKAAEQQLWEQEQTKSYVALAGDPGFADAMIGLVLGAEFPRAGVAAAATPGGTGAVRQAFELIQMANQDAKVWVSDPTWPNHLSILKHLAMPTRQYRYFDAQTGAVNLSGMLEDLKKAKPGDIVLLHGCCHNPTGANLRLTDWEHVISLMQERGLTPMVDIAYQGFGDGLEADATATRVIAKSMPETIIAASCSKNFGIYRERTGILMVVAGNDKSIRVAQDNLAYLNRQNFSFPPDHGARLVTMVLGDKALRADWEAELESVRTGMLALRSQLSAELQRLSGSDRFGFLADHRGMFSRLGTTPEKVAQLREDHGIYMVGDSRMNIAGLNAQTIPTLAAAIIACDI
ncbi:aromatic amino acid transaminase [Algirhabdus cladophorae]|uniref:amino acid aminotransferase n=1 Tax=Algirhabdus cladophorae TaxID=3377108 RepID=UPI003B84A0E5